MHFPRKLGGRKGKSSSKSPILLGVVFVKVSLEFSPQNREKCFPIWLAHIFQTGCQKTHQSKNFLQHTPGIYIPHAPNQQLSKGKVGYPWESTREIYQHISPIYELYNGCIGTFPFEVNDSEFLNRLEVKRGSRGRVCVCVCVCVWVVTKERCSGGDLDELLERRLGMCDIEMNVPLNIDRSYSGMMVYLFKWIYSKVYKIDTVYNLYKPMYIMIFMYTPYS